VEVRPAGEGARWGGREGGREAGEETIQCTTTRREARDVKKAWLMRCCKLVDKENDRWEDCDSRKQQSGVPLTWTDINVC